VFVLSAGHARQLFRVQGVKSVFLGSDFITISKQHDDIHWQTLKPEIYAVIMDFFTTNLPVIDDDATPPDSSKRARAIVLSTARHRVQADRSLLARCVLGVRSDDDDDTTAMIKELLDSRIRPTVQEDGGDVVFVVS
jgi:NFU1 iron-sulfur cluster scaffold homolog, mitochondrial